MNLCQGVQAWLSENSSDVFIFLFISQPILQFLQRVIDGYFKEKYPRFQRVQPFPGWGGGVQLFPGGWVSSAYFYRNPYNLWFSRGGGPEPLSPFWIRTWLPVNVNFYATNSKIVSEYDQEIPQSQTANNPVAPRGRAAQPSQDTRKTH